MGAREALARYHDKRDFTRTPEPRTGGRKGAGTLRFVVQKHHASHLHYDFRLELDGTLKSWAVPKGPCLDPTVKRMAVEVEDHPISYADFEGTIPPKQYGAGTVIVWDRGAWRPDGNARQALAAGKLKFELQGDKLRGHWTLVRMHGKPGDRQPAWLLIKEQDDAARPLADFDVVEALPDSVLNKPPPAPAPAPSPTALARPVRRALPATLAPQLATLADGPPAAPDEWRYELKFDGYRLLARIDGKSVQCFTRNGHDWSARVPGLVAALKQLGARSAWLDGEIVVDGDRGAPDFQALQNAFDRGATDRIAYWLFDLMFLDGRDLRALPIEQRRAMLADLLGQQPAAPLRLSEAFDAAPRDLLASAARLGFEGIVGKRLGSTYQSKRSPDWIKLKQHRRQEFVIGGYTAPRGSRSGFGALLLGVHDAAGKLQYCGNVGTGFDAKRLADIEGRLVKLHAKASPFAVALPTSVKAQWVRPQLVAEVSFGEWTREGRIRHSVFQGLRSDKPAHEIVHEEAQKMTALPKALSGVSHAGRVIDPQSGATKGDLHAYYRAAATHMLVHLRKRPVSLVRAPSGVGGELFFQKHAQADAMPGVKLLDAALDPGHEPLLQIDTATGLLSAAQMNAIELHTWNATSDAIDKPDRMTFDLDPGEGVPWAQVQEAALLTQVLLQELGLPAFLKTSGGKGLHVVVPLRRQHGWDTVKGFSQAVVVHLAQTIPSRFVAKSGPKNRIGKIFVDYLRNGFGATTASAWSVRARPGLGISVPVAWDELPGLTGGAHWTLASIGGRLEEGNRPWAAMAKQRAGLSAAMRALGYAPTGTPRRS